MQKMPRETTSQRIRKGNYKHTILAPAVAVAVLPLNRENIK